MGTNSFKVRVKPEGVYTHLEEDFEKRFDTSNSEINRQLPVSQKMAIGLMRDKLCA